MFTVTMPGEAFFTPGDNERAEIESGSWPKIGSNALME